MLTIINKTSAKGKVYAKVMGASKLMKGVECGEQINDTFILDYDNFSMDKANTLPDFIQEKIFASMEFNALMGEAEQQKQSIDEVELGPDGTPIDSELGF